MSLAGLEGLVELEGPLTIEGNNNLASIDALSNMSQSGNRANDWIKIGSNPKLTSLDGLEGIKNCYFMEVVYNATLQSIDVISNLENATASAQFSNNPLLSNCCVLEVLDGRDINIYLSSNSLGCNGLGEVQYACSPVVCQSSVTLRSQAEVDAFNCTELTGRLPISGKDISDLQPLRGLHKVNGGVYITNNPALTSLRGLYNLNQITNTLSITDNENLTSLYHLHNLSGNIGMVEIARNPKITSLQYLNGITKINSELAIKDLPALTSLQGFENIDQTLRVKIESNASLTSLAGLENLKSVKSLFIESNDNLQDLSGLESFTQFSESLSIRYNPNMTTLDGLDLDPHNIPDTVEIVVTDNPELSSCCILDALANISEAQVTVADNRAVCSDIQTIANVCGDALVICEGIIELSTQEEVNAFNCNIIDGSLLIYGTDITDLSPLTQLDSLSGTLLVQSTGLVTFNGLDNLTDPIEKLQIEGNPHLESITSLAGITIADRLHGMAVLTQNPRLSSLNGLEGIKSLRTLDIGNNENLVNLEGLTVEETGVLFIYGNDNLETISAIDNLHSVSDFFEISGNPKLTSLDGLNNLTAIGYRPGVPSYISIINNDNLTSLSSLEMLSNIGHAQVYITGNKQLTDCCIFEQFPHFRDLEFNHIVGNNAPGCDTREEILTICNTQTSSGIVVNFSPNPLTLSSTLQLSEGPYQGATYSIVDMANNTIKTGEFQNGEATLRKSDINKGFYFCKVVVDGKQAEVVRIVVE